MDSRLIVIPVLVLFAVLVFWVPESEATHVSGICYSRYSYRQAYTRYYRRSASYSYSCGWWRWRRCRRTYYYRQSYRAYRTRYASRFGCCSGYYRSGSRCYPICSPSCRNGGSCRDPYTCNCPSTWRGSYCQTDVNECSTGTHNCQQNCINTAGSYRCSCRTGYRLNSDQRTCSNINECTLGTHQCNHNCHDTTGSYTCSCRTGYTLASNGRTCNDNNECSLGTHNCGQACINNPGSFTCACYSGYRLQGDGRSCSDIDECAENTHRCDQNCHNSIGSYTCSCNTGYRLAADGRTCVDIDECRENTDGCEHNCHNNIGSYTCSCNTGYRLGGDGRSCNDIDECAENTDGCEQLCTNTVGSYYCSCNIGYRLDPDQHTCNDIDECAEGTHQCDQNCHNNIGSYTCSCNTGYRLNPDGFRCDDIDECVEGTHQCEHNCHNNVGSYTCSCRTGYRLNSDLRNCDDIDECAEGTHQCEHNCHNNIGSYTCSCRTGYRLNPDGFACDDIDECNEPVGSPNAHQCDQNCHNNVGSYTCSCNAGWLLDDDGFRCNDINECELDIDGCEHNCTNTLGSYICSCYLGYRLNSDQHTCSDIDECTEPDDAPTADRCDQNCHNNIGSYTCSCNIGWLLHEDGFRCIDIDECVPTGVGRQGDTACMQECINTPGSYHCDCRTGFNLTMDMVSCEDIDECAEQTAECDHICRNTIGSYSCSCFNGYTLDEINNVECHDVNECEEGMPCGRTSTCFNTLGSYHCNCSAGTTTGLDDSTCIDINECELDTHVCEHDCENTIGSYVCFCSENHTKTDDGISCLGTPQNVMVNIDGSRRVVVLWSPPVVDPRDGAIEQYTVVCRSPDDPTYFDQQFLDAAITQFSIENATPYTSYECCITVRTTNGDSPFACSTGITDQDSPDSPPSNIAANIDDPYLVTVRWTLPTQPSGDVTHYNLYIDYMNGTVVPVQVEGNTLSYDVTGLKPYQTVLVSLSASTMVGEGPRSGFVSYTTQETAPNIVDAGNEILDDNSAVITWERPSSPNGVVRQYDIRVYNKRTGYERSFTTPADASDLSISLNDLSPYTPYTVEVTASTSAGASEANVQIIYTKESAPVQPQITAAPRLDGENALITWQPISPDDSHGYLTRIEVAYQRASSREDDCTDFDPRQNSVTVIVVLDNLDNAEYPMRTLIADEEYCVAVRASTASGTSPYSAPSKIGLSNSALFQVRFTLTGSQECNDFVSVDAEEKIRDIKQALALYVRDNCDCSVFTSQYLTDATLACDIQNPKEFVLMGKLLSTDELSSDVIRDTFVQGWIDEQPNVPIAGETLPINSYCNSTLSSLDGATPVCFAPNPTIAPGESVGQRTVILALEIVGGIGGAALLALIIFIPVCIACCCCARKDVRETVHQPRREELNIRDHRPGSATSNQALLTDAKKVSTLKRGTLPRRQHVVDDYQPTYAAKDETDEGIRKEDLGRKPPLGYENPNYGDTDDFTY